MTDLHRRELGTSDSLFEKRGCEVSLTSNRSHSSLLFFLSSLRDVKKHWTDSTRMKVTKLSLPGCYPPSISQPACLWTRRCWCAKSVMAEVTVCARAYSRIFFSLCHARAVSFPYLRLTLPSRRRLVVFFFSSFLNSKETRRGGK